MGLSDILETVTELFSKNEVSIHLLIESLILSLFTEYLFRNSETKQFENIECDWPLFYCFFIIDGIFKNLDEQVREYQNFLFDKLLRRDPITGDYLIPKYYYVLKIT